MLRAKLDERGMELHLLHVDSDFIGYEVPLPGGFSAFIRIYIEALSQEWIELDWFELDKDVRGRGYGNIILSAIENTARELNMKGMGAAAFEHLIPFYKSMGWYGDANEGEMAFMTKEF